MIGFPLDSHVEFDRDGNPSFDRGITSAPMRSLIKSIMTDGVLPDASRLFDDITSDSFKVIPDEGMTVKVKKGFGICNGCMKFCDNDTPLVLENSDNTSDRIDTIVLRLNNNDDVRECEFHVITGTPATTPTRPTLVRNASIYDIGVADILVQANAEQITASKITDTRLDTDRCGLITAIAEFDTTNIYDQIVTDLAEFKSVQEADWDSWEAEQISDWNAWETSQRNAFYAWFATIQDVLDEDTAAHLLNMINATRDGIAGPTQGKTTSFPADGSIVETLQDGRKIITTFPPSGDIVETAYAADGVTVLWTNTTSFLANGDIQEVRS